MIKFMAATVVAILAIFGSVAFYCVSQPGAYDTPLAVVAAECPAHDHRVYRHRGNFYIYSDGELRRFVPAADCSLIDTGGFARFEKRSAKNEP